MAPWLSVLPPNAPKTKKSLSKSKATTVTNALWAWCSLPNGRVLNEELLKNGLAWWYQYFNPHQHDLAAYQSAAQQRKIGLWSAAQPEAPWDFRRAHHPIGRAPSAPLLQGAPDEP